MGSGTAGRIALRHLRRTRREGRGAARRAGAGTAGLAGLVGRREAERLSTSRLRIGRIGSTVGAARAPPSPPSPPPSSEEGSARRRAPSPVGEGREVAPAEGVGMNLYADRSGLALVAAVGGRSTRRERILASPWSEVSKPVPKPLEAAARLKPSMTERAESAAEMGAVTEVAAADGNGGMILVLLLSILGPEDGNTRRAGRGGDDGIIEGAVEVGDGARNTEGYDKAETTLGILKAKSKWETTP